MSETGQMSEHVVERDGSPDLRFEGVALASVGTCSPFFGPERTRWDKYTLYRTKEGVHILAHTYRTVLQGEKNSHEAWTGTDSKKLLEDACYENAGGEIIMPDVIKALARAAGIDLNERIE
jgi:hypothetical protein